MYLLIRFSDTTVTMDWASSTSTLLIVWLAMGLMLGIADGFVLIFLASAITETTIPIHGLYQSNRHILLSYRNRFFNPVDYIFLRDIRILSNIS
jgi:hypothetical protein